ncbi:MAG: hypothetical protein K2H02_00080 [Anaeroplasmataceae bacterium]|nr:hypothetical protein [Anaeroplasmataceae bacterium]
MKKIAGLCLMLSILILASCGKNKPSRVLINDIPEETVSVALGLDKVKDGVSLNQNLDKEGAYTDVKVSTDVKNSLFYQTIELDEVLEANRFQKIVVRGITFSGSIPYSDVEEMFSALNHEDYGITNDKLGIQFTSTDYSKSLIEDHKLSFEVTIDSLPKDYKKVTEDKALLVVTYLPIYGVYDDGTQKWTNIFIMVPVYYAFAYESNLSDYTFGVKNYTLPLDDNGYLPSAE